MAYGNANNNAKMANGINNIAPIKANGTQIIDAKIEEAPVVEVKKEEKVVVDENTFNVDVDEKFVEPHVPFVSESDEEN